MSKTTNKQSSSAAVQKGGRLLKPYASKPGFNSGYDDLKNVSKAALERIKVSALPNEKPDFDLPGATKDGLIAEWLKGFITAGLANKTLSEQNLLPKKADIAKYLGVSVGTVQNAIRFIEDEGFVESKQRIGTIISDPTNSNTRLRKLTSKRDTAVIAVKKLILERAIQPPNALPSAREIAKIIGSAPNTTRLALEYLATIGTVESKGTRGNKANWFLAEIPTLDDSERASDFASETLIDQVERDLKALIAAEFSVGSKLPSHLVLAERLKVSIKTVHDAMSRVIEQGIVQSKRGRYGSFILRLPDTDKLISSKEAASIFVPAQEALFYNYEKVEKHLKALIAKDYKAGDKMPSMTDLATQLDVSSNTIRKALQNLGEQGFVRFERGRYGGTFVVEIPKDAETKTFQWVSINPETISSYRKGKRTEGSKTR